MFNLFNQYNKCTIMILEHGYLSRYGMHCPFLHTWSDTSVIVQPFKQVLTAEDFLTKYISQIVEIATCSLHTQMLSCKNSQLDKHQSYWMFIQNYSMSEQLTETDFTDNRSHQLFTHIAIHCNNICTSCSQIIIHNLLYVKVIFVGKLQEAHTLLYSL